MGKVHNFLTPSPRIIWTFLNLGKNWFSMTPPPRPKLGKFWNVDYFDIIAPPLTLAKTIPKSYQTDTLGLFYSYIGYIVPNVAYISLISVPYMGLNFLDFSQIEITKIWPWILWYMGPIMVRYMQHLVHFWPIYG